METKLRFAPIIRVSTEAQEKKGESLAVQKAAAIRDISALGGIIPDSCWEYSGQEHATAQYERTKLNQLLEDASKNKFDAVWCADASRWSRDNLKSKQGLTILKKHGIRFFIGSSEYDLHNPEHSLFIGLSSEMGEFFASIQTQKSIKSKISLAQRGIHATGKPPYGRIFNKKTGQWSIDPEAQQKIVWAADQYLSGVSLHTIAKTLKVSHSKIHRVLTQKCGSTIEVKFRSPKHNINEVVKINVPELLPSETIKAIKDKTQANRTFDHGPIKHHHVLAHMVFCKACGLALFGQVNATGNNKRYYRHSRSRDKSSCHFHTWVPADDLENAVLAHLFSLHGNRSKIEQAINDSIPNREQTDKMFMDKAQFEKDLEKTEIAKKRIMDAITWGTLDFAEGKVQMEEVRGRISLLKDQIEVLERKLKDIPSQQLAAKQSLWSLQMLEERFRAFPSFAKMTFEDKRGLAQAVFGGKDSDGRRLGVYLHSVDGRLQYEIRGTITTMTGRLPMPLHEAQDLLRCGPDEGFPGINPFQETVSQSPTSI